MNGWSWLGLALGALFLADGFKLRRRLAALPIIPAAPNPSAAMRYALLLTPGASLDAEGQAAAAAWAHSQGLQAVDLVPGHWRALRAMGWAQVADPREVRRELLMPGQTAWQGLLVDKELLKRASIPEEPPANPVALMRLAQRLKRYAPSTYGMAVAPGLKPAPITARDRFCIQRELFLTLSPTVFAGQAMLFALTAAAAWLGGWAGLAGVVAFHLQPLIATVGAPVGAWDVLPVAAFALPIQVWEWIAAVLSAPPDLERRERVAQRRPWYQEALAPGMQRFFEPRREHCPVCQGTMLRVEQRQPDRVQHKPGLFTLERCRGCGVILQNPRLSLEGLSFYYRDFYDGLGEGQLEAVFGLGGQSYRDRARFAGVERPGKWLDVGGGYGHFCLVARAALPETRFECLDMGESVDEGLRRGWIERGIRGLLPERAAELEGQYDVVSMSHCLEHTREPQQELASARRVLRSNGVVIIEVPDPEALIRRLLRSFWLPYFQPQHQHLLSVANLRLLLEREGFEVQAVERGPAHIMGDCFFAAFFVLNALAPGDLPWRTAAASWSRYWGGAVWGLGMPLLASAAIADAVVNGLRSVPGMSNAYRIRARRVDGASPPPAS